MERHGIVGGVLTLALVVCSAAALAHEECDDEPSKPAAVAETAKQPTSANVTIRLFQYQPGQIEVKAGTKVTWVNEDEIFHTVTSENGSDLNGALDGKGKNFSYTFDRPGSFAYYCDRHEHMRGEIIVR
ncbi:MAG TPA: plastocyanin/azurin family copper-binding protein [Candidatus Binatia bacterium]|nr:plastocyanin/azurin family copper-binding protein [Candidatus Binatia bacterium]